jgi:uroporphyrinogen-III synthase
MSIPPLRGVKVLVTRPVEQAQAWSEALVGAGADVISYPTILVTPPPSWEAFDESFRRLKEYDWIVFASATTVRFAFTRYPAGIEALSSPPPRIAAVGGETARMLSNQGLRVSLVPGQQRQEGLVEAFADLRPGTRILFPQAVDGRDDLSKFLTGHGCIVDVVPASQTLPIRPLPPVPRVDVATFASPSRAAT